MELQELEKKLSWANNKLFTLLENQPNLVKDAGEAEFSSLLVEL